MLTPADLIFSDSSNSSYVEISSPVYNSRPFELPKEYSISSSISGVKNLNKNISKAQVYHLHNALMNPHLFHKSPEYYKLNDLFFPGVRYLDNGLVLFERPPTQKLIDISADFRDEINDDTSLYTYYISIPWQVYIASYNPNDMRLYDVKMFFTHSSLLSSEQKVYAPPMFNFFSNGKLCRPFFEDMDDVTKYPQSIGGIMASAYDWIWNSGFNFDITENISEFLVNKRHFQFENYITSPNAIKHLNWLKSNPLISIPRSAPTQYLNSFFTCWEDIPLEKVSEIVWSPYTNADFFYLEYQNSQDLIDEYCSLNSYCVHHDDDDESAEEHGSDNCIEYEELISLSDYIAFVRSRTINNFRSVIPAIQASYKYSRVNNIVFDSNSINSTSKFRTYLANYINQNIYS